MTEKGLKNMTFREFETHPLPRTNIMDATVPIHYL